MVTKLERLVLDLTRCSVLAKILMVTKLTGLVNEHFEGSVLAKILMVTKRWCS